MRDPVSPPPFSSYYKTIHEFSNLHIVRWIHIKLLKTKIVSFTWTSSVGLYEGIENRCLGLAAFWVSRCSHPGFRIEQAPLGKEWVPCALSVFLDSFPCKSQDPHSSFFQLTIAGIVLYPSFPSGWGNKNLWWIILECCSVSQSCCPSFDSPQITKNVNLCDCIWEKNTNAKTFILLS